MLYKNCRWQDSNHGVGSDHSANWAHNQCPTKNSPTHFLKNILFPASFFFIFVFSMQLTVNKCSQTSRINGFEPRTSSVGSQLVHQKLPPSPLVPLATKNIGLSFPLIFAIPFSLQLVRRPLCSVVPEAITENSDKGGNNWVKATNSYLNPINVKKQKNQKEKTKKAGKLI